MKQAEQIASDRNRMRRTMRRQRVAPGPVVKRFLCSIGLHRFIRREARLKPGTFILRCRVCGLLRVKKPKLRPR